jgi:hypothetical protein
MPRTFLLSWLRDMILRLLGEDLGKEANMIDSKAQLDNRGTVLADDQRETAWAACRCSQSGCPPVVAHLP